MLEVTEEERRRAHDRSRRMYETDQYSNLHTAIDRGRREGWEEGLKIGREKARAELLNLLNSGLSVDEIKERLKT